MRFCGRVRAATVSDVADVTRINIVSWNEGFGHLMGLRNPSPNDDEHWKGEFTSGPGEWWVAEMNGRPVGFAGIRSSRDPVRPGLGELDTIAVDPPDWRTGVGRALMTVALEGLRGAGYTEAVVWTPAGYERGHGFYRATGWLPDGGRRDGGRQVSFRQSLTRPSSDS